MGTKACKCRECESEIRDGVISAKDAIGLNRKLLGRKVASFFCADCLAEYLGISAGDLPEMGQSFKEQGCGLF